MLEYILQYALPLVFFTFSTSVTPGPNNIMVAASGTNFGIRQSIPHCLGICIGFPVMVFAVGSGLGSLFQQYPAIHQIITYAGIIYLLFLAYKIAVAGDVDDKQLRKKSKPLTFIQASAFQWVNPKGWMMALGAIAAFTTPDGNYLFEIFIISSMFALACIPSVILWALFGVAIGKMLHNKAALKLFNYTMASLLVGSIILLFI